jgi:hypothetical protein
VTLIKLQKVWGIGLFLQWQQLITVLGVNGEFASGIPSIRTPRAVAPTWLHLLFNDHKSRARLTRSLRDQKDGCRIYFPMTIKAGLGSNAAPRPGRRLLHLFLKDHKPTAKFTDRYATKEAQP